MELSVVWGNTINLLSLKDLNLRDLKGNHYVQWDDNASYMSATSNDNYGFLAIDYGRGLSDYIDKFRYTHPCINIEGILNIITESSGVVFDYPERFNETFKTTWIPLTTKNADGTTWADTFGVLNMTGNLPYPSGLISTAIFTPIYMAIDILNDDNTIGLQGGYHRFTINNGTVNVTGDYSDYELWITLPLFDETRITKLQTVYDSGTNKTSVVINYNERFYINPDNVPDYNYLAGAGVYLQIEFVNKTNANDRYVFPINETTTMIQLKVDSEIEEVPYGFKYPIIANLPDMGVVDFLKEIMQMFGLWTYYNFKGGNIVQFLSMDDIYSFKSQAYDWTNKLVLTNRGRYSLTFVYGDYAQQNHFRYDNDKDIKTNADGILEIDNTTISKSKDVVKLQFSPSKNQSDANSNVYAFIELYDQDGNINDLKPRVLKEIEYNKDGTEYKSAYFNDELYFSGEKGLLKTYYSTYQHILRRPIVSECYVYLKNYDLFQYKEVLPVFIEGVFYMPITITVQADGLAVCKLLKMPYKEA